MHATDENPALPMTTHENSTSNVAGGKIIPINGMIPDRPLSEFLKDIADGRTIENRSARMGRVQADNSGETVFLGGENITYYPTLPYTSVQALNQYAQACHVRYNKLMLDYIAERRRVVSETWGLRITWCGLGMFAMFVIEGVTKWGS